MQIAFTQLNGPGTLIKGGNGNITFAALATGANTPGIGIAGPQGRTLAGSIGNITFTPGAVALQNLSVSGFYTTPATKSISVASAISVNANPGNVSGALAVNGSTTFKYRKLH